MKRRGFVAVAALLALVLSACTSDDNGKNYRFTGSTKSGQLISVDKRKPTAVSGVLLTGGKTSLKASLGKVTVINFWASWCGPCKGETPTLVKFYGAMKSRGLAFLSINAKDDAGDARSFVSDYKIDYPVIFDEQGQTLLQLGNIPGQLPVTVLIDKRGDVAAVYRGAVDDSILTAPVDRLLAEK